MHILGFAGYIVLFKVLNSAKVAVDNMLKMWLCSNKTLFIDIIFTCHEIFF